MWKTIKGMRWGTYRRAVGFGKINMSRARTREMKRLIDALHVPNAIHSRVEAIQFPVRKDSIFRSDPSDCYRAVYVGLLPFGNPSFRVYAQANISTQMGAAMTLRDGRTMLNFPVCLKPMSDTSLLLRRSPSLLIQIVHDRYSAFSPKA